MNFLKDKTLTLTALGVTTLVILALTMLKAFYRIGYLWLPERQRVRKIEWQPFDMILNSKNWFAPVFETVGNILLFIPFGLLVFVVLHQSNRLSTWSRARLALVSIVVGAGFSLIIETAQYVFALGRSDIDDLWCNTLGTIIGVGLAVAAGPQRYRLWCWIALAAAVVFGVIVSYGEELGDAPRIASVMRWAGIPWR
ncbi:glycopeptide antibiotics resistance protein [Corynebacterium mustelae]|uniref:Glycopeptide antibiotics resistance protein n=1 Tax=Corynebacterium mustelae TaxID=571915 RepID=A0A0G3H1N7_9CORY|nr:VanZ family protein [Corynebacterium mustelae]AKK07326.1 glycopeptide antibiotics resistance protein [Corynebacterium mustelae]